MRRLSIFFYVILMMVLMQGCAVYPPGYGYGYRPHYYGHHDGYGYGHGWGGHHRWGGDSGWGGHHHY
jgi:hypothetical protein